MSVSRVRFSASVLSEPLADPISSLLPNPGVRSATHGNRYVFTYLNKKAEPSGLQGKFPFPVGAVLAKESFEGQSGKPGSPGPLFIMENPFAGKNPCGAKK